MKIKTKSQIDNVQPEPKTNSEPQPIVPTSSPTIGNTLVSGSWLFDIEDSRYSFTNLIHYVIVNLTEFLYTTLFRNLPDLKTICR